MISDPHGLVLFVVAALAPRSRRFVRTQRYVTGSVYVGLGVATASAGGSDD
ncbi:MAG TPA: hypothetical protein VK926_08180 [Gaiellaceae bacterium]|nr:hypothetical protein [Gaiellaceae bacterium]